MVPGNTLALVLVGTATAFSILSIPGLILIYWLFILNSLWVGPGISDVTSCTTSELYIVAVSLSLNGHSSLHIFFEDEWVCLIRFVQWVHSCNGMYKLRIPDI